MRFLILLLMTFSFQLLLTYTESGASGRHETSSNRATMVRCVMQAHRKGKRQARRCIQNRKFGEIKGSPSCAVFCVKRQCKTNSWFRHSVRKVKENITLTFTIFPHSGIRGWEILKHTFFSCPTKCLLHCNRVDDTTLNLRSAQQEALKSAVAHNINKWREKSACLVVSVVQNTCLRDTWRCKSAK
jgi:hypothetical protein